MSDFGHYCYQTQSKGKTRRHFDPSEILTAIVTDNRDNACYWYNLDPNEVKAFEAWVEVTFGSPDEPEGSTWQPYDLTFQDRK